MTPANVVSRLLAMDGREMWFRASTAGRRAAGRVAYMARRPQWRREALASALRADSPSMQPAIACLHEGDWLGAHHVLMHHIATRRPRFLLDPAARSERARTILAHHPNARGEAVRRGDRVAAGQFDLLGYRGLTFATAAQPAQIDWRLDPVHQRQALQMYWSRVPYLEPACGDHKVVWELNRHQSWLSLGRAYWLSNDPRYRDAFIAYFNSWMESNPPLTGVNWSSMLEISLRSLSWLWALHFFVHNGVHDGVQDGVQEGGDGAIDDSPWTVDLFLGLDRQLRLVEQNLSRYFSPNTHLLGEALALYVVGRALPELRRAVEWERLGRTVLIEQVSKQIHVDGGHAELSTHYHRYTLDFYLLALAIARQTSDPEAPVFAAAAERLAHYARTMSDDNGRLPGIGDDDGGSLFPICGRNASDVSDSLQLAAQLLDRPALAIGQAAEEAIWITGVAPAAPRVQTSWPSTALPATGYFVSRSDRGDHLTIDAGRHGFLNGGHAHSDALAVALTVRGLPFLIDPGTGCYTIDPGVRDRFRSTRYHNTVTIDGRSQSIPDGPFQWRSTAHAKALEWRTEEGIDFFEGAHDGYAPLLHHRAVLSRPGCWFVVDSVLGTGVHLAEVHWHLDPSWNATVTGHRSVRARHPDGTTMWVLTLGDECEVFHGSPESDLGWCAPVYGPVVPTSTVRMRRSSSAPFDLVTVIVEASEEPVVERIVDERLVESAMGFRVQRASSNETVLFTRKPATNNGGDSGIWSIDNGQTDARLLCCHGAGDTTVAGKGAR
jgi:hypothetical protein